MADRCSCTLNGVSPTALHPAISVQDIEELSPRMQISTAMLPTGGSQLLRRVRESLSVRVKLLIAAYDLKERQTAFAQLMAWAEQGGSLCIGARPGQTLAVSCTALPSLRELYWLETLSITFTAYQPPYWQDAQPHTFTMTDSIILSVAGTAPETPLDLLIHNDSSAQLNTLEVHTAGMLHFDNLAIAPGDALRIHHDRGVFAAETVSEGATPSSVLLCRSLDSDDDLLLLPGKENTVRLLANVDVTAQGSYKGRYC